MFMAAAAAFASACVGVGPESSAGDPDGPSVAIDIAALNLQGVGDVVWDIAVENGATPPQTVWQRRIASSGYGDGGGSASYVGPCDADPTGDVSDNTVKVWVVGIYSAPVTTVGTFAAGGAGGVVGAPVSFQNPTADAPLSQTVTCAPNTDVPVRFDVSLMRPAQQGFFDIAVGFNDLFCSAKLDCCDDTDGTPGCATDGSEDIALLFTDGGSRGSTMVLGFACTAGADADVTTELYFNPIELDCTSPSDFGTGFTADIAIDPSGALGNQCAAGAVGAGQCAAVQGATADTYLYQVGVYRGTEQLTSGGQPARKAYWNVALGVKRPAITSCWLRTSATADDADGTPAIDGGTIAAGTVYPVIQWHAELDSCTAEGLAFDDPSAMVRPTYTQTSDSAGHDFAYRAVGSAATATGAAPEVMSSAILWLDASQITGVADGALVSSWPDRSGNGFDAFQLTATKQPTYTASSIGGQPALSFDGANDILKLTGDSRILTAMTVFTVYRIRAGATNSAAYYPWALGGDNNTTGQYFGFETIIAAGGGSEDTLDAFAGFGNDARATYAGISAWDSVHVYSVVTTGFSHQTNVYVNGDPATMSGTGNNVQLGVPFSTPTGANFAGVGGVYDGGYAFRGDIAEFILFDSALSTTDRQVIEGYLLDKYGLP